MAEPAGLHTATRKGGEAALLCVTGEAWPNLRDYTLLLERAAKLPYYV